MKSNPFVSVVVITYGHALFLEKCLTSIIDQKTNFRFEIIIANDNSPDESHDIITQFIAGSQNDKIDLKYYCHNSNKGMSKNFIWALDQCKGSYIAYCEGDDFWLDDRKLQMQVDFLEKNEDYILTCGAYQTNNGTINNILTGQMAAGYTFLQEEALNRWITKSLTICFRNISGINTYLTKFSQARDTHLIYYLLKWGKGYYFNKVLGFYNIHEGGVVSKKSKIQRALISFNVFTEFYEKERTEVIRKKRLGYSILLFKYGHKNISVFKHLNSFRDLILAVKLLIKG